MRKPLGQRVLKILGRGGALDTPEAFYDRGVSDSNKRSFRTGK